LGSPLPASRFQPGFPAKIIQHFFTIPFLFRCHLRKKNGVMVVFVE
jgi:hypothetical protein